MNSKSVHNHTFCLKRSSVAPVGSRVLAWQPLSSVLLRFSQAPWLPAPAEWTWDCAALPPTADWIPRQTMEHDQERPEESPAALSSSGRSLLPVLPERCGHP